MSGDDIRLKAHYIDLHEARKVLAEMGIELTIRQMKRAASMNADGLRKIPFFLDPIDGRLKIDKRTLIDIYWTRQAQAKNNSQILRPN